MKCATLDEIALGTVTQGGRCAISSVSVFTVALSFPSLQSTKLLFFVGDKQGALKNEFNLKHISCVVMWSNSLNVDRKPLKILSTTMGPWLFSRSYTRFYFRWRCWISRGFQYNARNVFKAAFLFLNTKMHYIIDERCDTLYTFLQCKLACMSVCKCIQTYVHP